jgi:hypothetical protein
MKEVHRLHPRKHPSKNVVVKKQPVVKKIAAPKKMSDYELFKALLQEELNTKE